MEEADVAPESMVTMERVKFKVVEEFADYLSGRRHKASVQSQIEDHLVPVQMMSGIYRSHILRQNNQPNVVKSAFGVEESVPSAGTAYLS
jgi:hypothetical protein